MAQPVVQIERLMSEIEALAAFTAAPPPAVTRVIFSEQDLAARAWLTQRFAAAGCAVRQDAVGNLFARWPADAPGPVVGTGSHTDAIPHAGRYDGVVGVLGGLEAIRALQAAGIRPAKPIELLMFTSEEPTRYGIGCLGSRLLSGALDPARAAGLKDAEGQTLDALRRTAGCSGELADVRLPESYYHAFLELHIEQGPLLEQHGEAIGIVTAIAAPAALRVTFHGQGGHAGAVLMPDRRDALPAAAELALAVERIARGTGFLDSVATVGVCDVHPRAINSIPSQVTLEIDVRDIDGLRRDGMVKAIREEADEIARRRRLEVTDLVLNADPPATCDEGVVAAVERACRQAGLTSRHMVSRAYHDSLFMARIAPTAMVFIPCRNGWSHRPDEYSAPEHIAAGVQVLTLALADLAS